MKKLARFIAYLLLGCGCSASPALATCDAAYIRIAGQIPDVVFTSGMPSKVRIVPWWASFNVAVSSCGVLARSTTPGVSIQDTYGCVGDVCPIRAPGEWAAVKSSYTTGSSYVTRAGGGIALIFDGTTARGTEGMVEIGIIDNDLGIQDGNHVGIIATVNVYVESPKVPATWFTVTSIAANTTDDFLILDHPYLDARPAARMFVSHVRNPVGAAVAQEWNHPIGVQYNAASARWTIRNLDGAPMRPGVGFNVRVDPTAKRVCTPRNLPVHGFVQGHEYAVVHDPISDGTVWAMLMVTPVGGAPHPIAVRYVSPHWQIVYTDGALMAPATCFNVKVFAFTQYLEDPAIGDLSGRSNASADVGVGVDAGGYGQDHSDGPNRLLQFSWAFGNPALPIIVTANLTPLGWRQFLDPRYVGLHYDRTRIPNGWSVYHEDGSDMSHFARFNVWAAPELPPP
jgi:hypothetical protein